MKKIITFIILFCIACNPPRNKPFIIVGKESYYNQTQYIYRDSIGAEYSFIDDVNKYNVGDTIK